MYLLIATILLHTCTVSKPEQDIKAITSALHFFKMKNGHYPDEKASICALVGSYLDELPLDPWGRPYKYRYPGFKNSEGFDLYSLGADGLSESGGEDPDDINNWGHNKSGACAEDLVSKISFRTVSIGVISFLLLYVHIYYLYTKWKRKYIEVHG